MIGLVADEDGVSEAELFDVVRKPVSEARLEFVADRAVRQLGLVEELRQARQAVRSREGYEGLVGRSGAVERIRAEIARLADTDLSVWFTGEPGSGKQHAARALHSVSRRAEGAFVVIDCATLRAPEWTSQWTALGAGGESAETAGTVYLKELLALDPEMQQRVADTIERWPRLDVRRAVAPPVAPRVLVGSREDPEQAARKGRLLDALYRRTAESQLCMPPLRDRGGDIALLARHFISSICDVNRLPPIALSPEALEALQRFEWPGNVREIRNTIEHAVILATEGVVRLQDLPDRVREGRFAHETAADEMDCRATGPFREAKRVVVDAFERAYLADLMERFSGNVTAAAQQAGMLRSALQRLLRKHELKSASFRKRRSAVGGSRPAESRVD